MLPKIEVKFDGDGYPVLRRYRKFAIGPFTWKTCSVHEPTVEDGEEDAPWGFHRVGRVQLQGPAGARFEAYLRHIIWGVCDHLDPPTITVQVGTGADGTAGGAPPAYLTTFHPSAYQVLAFSDRPWLGLKLNDPIVLLFGSDWEVVERNEPRYGEYLQYAKVEVATLGNFRAGGRQRVRVVITDSQMIEMNDVPVHRRMGQDLWVDLGVVRWGLYDPRRSIVETVLLPDTSWRGARELPPSDCDSTEEEDNDGGGGDEEEEASVWEEDFESDDSADAELPKREMKEALGDLMTLLDEVNGSEKGMTSEQYRQATKVMRELFQHQRASVLTGMVDQAESLNKQLHTAQTCFQESQAQCTKLSKQLADERELRQEFEMKLLVQREINAKLEEVVKTAAARKRARVVAAKARGGGGAEA